MSLNDTYAARKSQRTAPSTGANIVFYARPKDGVDDRTSVRSLFPGWNMALSYHSILSTTDYDLKPVSEGGKFPDATAETFIAIGMALGEAIETAIPRYFVSLEYCDDAGFKALVREVAAGEHLIGKSEASWDAQRAGLALATVVDCVTDIPA